MVIEVSQACMSVLTLIAFDYQTLFQHTQELDPFILAPLNPCLILILICLLEHSVLSIFIPTLRLVQFNHYRQNSIPQDLSRILPA